MCSAAAARAFLGVRLVDGNEMVVLASTLTGLRTPARPCIALAFADVIARLAAGLSALLHTDVLIASINVDVEVRVSGCPFCEVEVLGSP
jgi:hypothetical protein